MSTDANLEQRILEAAEVEFREKGFKRSSMRSIALKAEIAVGTIYNYVNNKYDLFYKVLMQNWQELKIEITKMAEIDRPIRDKLYNVGLLQLNFMRQHMIVWHEMLQTDNQMFPLEFDKKIKKGTYQFYLDKLTIIFEQARIKGEVRGDFKQFSDKKIALYFIYTINSLNPSIDLKHGIFDNNDNKNISQSLEEMLEIFLRGVCQ